ncbi:TetR/AcrR family transcriptional regulator [Chenggangzhangella methanolivorans]|uniref:TetR/AcrR family transcriptional regulator n=1 Tax=Chenggangzhangella methanolivorans TaxID=1437009 RepID=A0A9E6RAJ6_9HYPH|nr:TetR/AcrR family transcriptional regulator [Chenggangzhangella methanolivorans]QZO01211.1 TetR/AcrR family transcriptional regulator [Chenggangzhangella methanolivorans]
MESGDRGANEAGPPAAPTGPGRASKRDQIVAAARELFLAHGYGATSMDAVARDAPVSKRTLYNHFESKQALFLAVLRISWANLSEAPPVRPEDDVRDTLRGYVARLEEHWRHPDVLPFLRLLIAEGTRFPELSDIYYQAGKAPAVAELTGYFEGKADALGLTAEARAVQFLGMVKEALFWPRVLGFPPAKDRDAVVDAAIARLVD